MGIKGLDLSSLELTEADIEAAEEASKKIEGSFDVEKIIPEEIFKWLHGETSQPEHIRKLGDDITSKLNWFIVFSILSQYARIPHLFRWLGKAEQKVFDLAEDFNTADIEDAKILFDKYKKASTELESVLEFARKFTLQNRDVLKGHVVSSEDRSLLDKIKKLKPEEVEEVIELLKDRC